jgi:site-specific DNA recombinase
MTKTTGRKAKRAVLYLRQSKAKADSISLEIQDEVNRTYCATQGYEVVGVVTDPNTSAYRDWRKRKHYPEVFDYDADVLVIYRWSRLSRRRVDQYVMINALEDAGLQVEAATEPVDPSTAGGRMSRDNLLNYAAYESEMKAEQIKDAHARRLKAGLTQHGQARFGYEHPTKTSYVPDPVTGPALAECYTRYINGAGFIALATWMTEQGHRTTTGREFSGHTLAQVLDSGFGAGLLVQHTKVQKKNQKKPEVITSYLPAAHEGVIDPDEWTSYRAARKRRRTEPPTRRTAGWYLTGLATCHCGANLVLVSTKRSDRVYQYARCTLALRGGGCRGVSIPRGDLEGRVAIWLGGRLEELAAHLPSREAEHAVAEQALRTAQEAVDAAVAALGRLAVRLGRGLLDDDAYTAAQAELAAERDAAEVTREEARQEVARLGPLPSDVFERLEQAPSMTPGEWGAQIGQLLRRVVVTAETLTYVPVVGQQETEERPRGVRRTGYEAAVA